MKLLLNNLVYTTDNENDIARLKDLGAVEIEQTEEIPAKEVKKPATKGKTKTIEDPAEDK